MKKVRRFGVSLEEEVLDKLDAFVSKHNFPNRSQAIRYLIRDNIIEDAWREDKEVAGCVVLVYDHHRRDLVNSSLDIQHKFGGLIIATQHVHLDHHNCLEMIAVKGTSSRLQKLADSLISLKGVKHGRLVMTGV